MDEKKQNDVLLGVDTGGTFTDFVVLETNNSVQTLRIHKLLSTPQAPEKAILQGILDLGLMDVAISGQLQVIHGSTVATNAALEGKGVRTVYITNRGFKDILTIGRQTRKQLYNLQPSIVPPPVEPQLCLETGGRLDRDGNTIDKLKPQDLTELREKVLQLQPDAIAINLLFSFLDDRFEKMIEDAMPNGIFISRSSFVLPEYKEYERGVATWLNAWLGPLVQQYLDTLRKALAPSPVSVMQSSGGTIDAEQASTRAVNMLLSGPAGGLAAARFISQLANSERLLTFDMGGTSTDVALVDGDIQLTNEGRIGHYPVAIPMVDMHTIGAGGGSIASIDAGGLLKVGPESAGANPGPACYGQGANQPTVTDADAVLGRLRPDNFLGGEISLDIDAATNTIKPVAGSMGMTIEEAALGIIQIANEHMVHALRVISIQRGYNPAEFKLCCFGGAGGLHVCALAQTLQIKHAIIPIHGGVFSALGMLVAPRERQLSRTYTALINEISEHQIFEIIAQLNNEGRQQLIKEGVTDSQITQHPSLDLRYEGQSYTLNVSLSDCSNAVNLFHQKHQQRYGHEMDLPVELVNIRLALKAHSQDVNLPTLKTKPLAIPINSVSLYGVKKKVQIYQREHLAVGQVIKGPALIVERISTTLLAENWQGQIDPWGNLLLDAL